MEVPPHPHTGLQTVTWLLDGEISTATASATCSRRPGELNLMTAGRGIAHSERSPAVHPPVLHGVQLWVALPDPARAGAAGFEHHADLPRWRAGDLDVTCSSASSPGDRSPAVVHTPLVGVQVELGGEAPATMRSARFRVRACWRCPGTAEAAGVGFDRGRCSIWARAARR